MSKTKWQKYTNEQQNYLDIGYELINKKDLFADSYKFWDKVYQKNYWNPTAPNPADYTPTVAKSAKPTVKEQPSIEIAAKAERKAPEVTPSTEKKAPPTEESKQKEAKSAIPPVDEPKIIVRTLD